MPTGYTADVATGKITDFNEYALQCARAFGACILLRDEPMSSEIPKFEMSEHYENALVTAIKDLEDFKAMNEEQRRELHAVEYAEKLERGRAAVAEKEEQRKRYEAMLEKAKAFKAPTVEHKGYARFLVEQLESSIEWDCGTSYYDDIMKEIPFETWEKTKLEDLRKDCDYQHRWVENERKRVNDRNRWVDELKKALGVTPKEPDC